ncbi:glycosyltransferase [Alteromonas hispanica]|uniref:Glycosyltransferase n=1 Tax=Alteromonas hispanica TaxID=315421 RepID=A0A6L9MUZ1_9ALTE|nr:glycosyltransferase [Alteromonas hispanica]
MKKVLLLTQNFPPTDGGSCRWFWELYSRLPTDKVVVATDIVDGSEQFDNTHNMLVERIPLFSKEWGIISLAGILFYLRSIKNVMKLVKKHQIEEIHCGRVIHEGVIALAVKMFTGVPYKCFVHGEDVETAATSREHSALVSQVCKKASRLICNSHNSAMLVEKLGFASKGVCSVLHPGVDTDVFKPAAPDELFREQVGWQNKTVMLTVGRLQRRKGQDFLIKAMPELLKHKPDLHYAVVGRGELEKELRDSISELGLERCVTLHTDFSDEQLVKAYQQCDFFILPNRTIGNDIEGFGMVLVEAQACGKYVIAGESGGTAETMIIGNTGDVIDCSNVNKLSSNLLNKLSSEMEVNLDDSRNYIVTSFSWSQYVLKAKKSGLIT